MKMPGNAKKDALDLACALTDADMLLLIEALEHLLEVKSKAFETISVEFPINHWTPEDFAIPRIKTLTKRFIDAYEEFEL